MTWIYQFHPDKNQRKDESSDESATLKITQIVDAYAFLMQHQQNDSGRGREQMEYHVQDTRVLFATVDLDDMVYDEGDSHFSG